MLQQNVSGKLVEEAFVIATLRQCFVVDELHCVEGKEYTFESACAGSPTVQELNGPHE